MPSIDDYLCLKFSNAIISENTVTWNISPTYYTNQRSTVCFMSLERCNIIFAGSVGYDTTSTCATMLRTSINGQNQQVSDNQFTMLDIVETQPRALVVGEWESLAQAEAVTTPKSTYTRHNAVKFSNTNPMQLLVSARPTTISISIQNNDFVSLVTTGVVETAVINQDENYIILRFEYDDVKDIQRDYKDQFTRKM